MTSISATASAETLKAAFTGGAAAGAIDIVYAILASDANGVSADRVLQSIASGLLGSEAYRGGATTAALGLTLHFLMTFAMALLFVEAARRFAPLRQHLLLGGLAYGAAIYFAMRWVVVPLSRFPGDLRSFNLVGLAVHMIGVGLVIALAARRFGAAPSRPSPFQGARL